MADEKSNGNNSEVTAKNTALARRIQQIAPYKFKKGQSGNPKGRRKGQRDYRTLFWIGMNHLANVTGSTPEQVEEALHAAGLEKALKGDFFFWQEIMNRVHGKPSDKMDLNVRDMTLEDLIRLADAKPTTSGGTKKKN